MTRTRLLLSMAFAFALGADAWAIDELIPSGKKSRQRHPRENPLTEIGDDMHAVARRLKKHKTDDATQKRQEEILKKLDDLIEKARKQQQKQSQGGQGQAKKRHQQQKQQPKLNQQKTQQQKKTQQKKHVKQQQKKSKRPGIGQPGGGQGQGPLHTDAEEWGSLPPAIREQLLQTQGEGFPLRYRELLRRYYRELSRPRE